MRTRYDERFFSGLSTLSRQSAERIVPIAMELLHPTSVVDVGCGPGTWLAVFAEHGATDLLGLDGPHVPAGLREVSAERFRAVDLDEPLDVGRRFDLAVCLEVAEHLAPATGPRLVRDLVGLAPAVLFSAAIPFQGGVGHRNERWPDYWAKLFSDHAYRAVDCIRPRVWSDPCVACWYAQNTILYVHASTSALTPTGVPARLVHPEIFWDKVARPLTVLELVRRFAISSRHMVSRLVRRARRLLRLRRG